MWTDFYSNYQSQLITTGLALASFVGAFLALHLVRYLLVVLVRKINMRVDISRQLVRSLKKVSALTLLIVAGYIALQRFDLSEQVSFVVKATTYLAVTIQLLMVANDWVRFAFGDEGFVPWGQSNIKTIRSSIVSIAIISVWTIGLLLMLDNLGFNVAAIIAGLGVGGLAVGLALQSIFKDLIASFAIGFDKPFEVGDFIAVGDFNGNIERVGLKTTRVKSLSGEQLVFPNSVLVESNIRNFKRLEERRIVFAFGVTYDIDQDLLSEIPAIVKNIVEAIPSVRFDRAHFKEFGDSALNFEVVYYVELADYTKYMDIQQDINLKLRAQLQNKGAVFAFPTQTLDFNIPQVKEIFTVSNVNASKLGNSSDEATAH